MLSCITITILLGSLFLSFLSFGNYRNEVIANNRPGYGLEFVYAMQRKEISEFMEQLEGIAGIEDVSVYKAGEEVSLTFEGVKENERLGAFYNLLPDMLVPFHFGLPKIEGEEGEKLNEEDTIKTTIYGVEQDSKLFSKLEESIINGTIDLDKFRAGEEVIVFVPMYFPGKNAFNQINKIEDLNLAKQTTLSNRMGKYLSFGDVYETSYDKRHATYYKTEDMIKPGDTITLSSLVQSYGSESTSYKKREVPVTVGAVISYFPESGIWPFTDTKEEYAVLSSYLLLENIFPSTIYGTGGMTPKMLKEWLEAYPTTQFGKTLMYIDNNNEASYAETDAKLSKMADSYGFTLHNYREANEKLLDKAINVSIITCLLGISSALIALAILYNILISKAEQERERTGILQAIGVTNWQFRLQQIKNGLFYGISSLVVSHILIAFLLLGTSLWQKGEMPMTIHQFLQDIVYYRLWSYPWIIHGGICIFFLVITVWLHVISTKKIMKNAPVLNIRGLKE